MATDTNVAIYVFNLNGSLVWKNNYALGASGGKAGYNEVPWNGLNIFGTMLSNNAYIVRIIDTSTGKVLSSCKFMVLRGISAKPESKNMAQKIDPLSLSLFLLGGVIFGAPGLYVLIRRLRKRKYDKFRKYL